MKFEEYRISGEIKQNLADLGFKRPTDIQFKCITPILKGEDVLAIAQTGTGKTAAFVIPLLHKVHQAKKTGRPKGIQALVMAPTRELALQITDVFHKIGKNTRIKTLCLFGGVEQDPQIRQLVNGVDILVSTPGRMFDLIHQGYVVLDHMETLVLDEADHMLALGFIRDIEDVLRHLPNRRQTLFFSATIDDQIKKLAYNIVRNAIRIQIAPDDRVNKNIHHTVAFIEMDDKRFFLERVINENPTSKIIVFVRTKVRAERVKAAMQRVGIKGETLHGDKEQQERLLVLKQFRENTCSLLIATDITARGIDIPEVDFVINYDLPDEPENYVHRVGRTGRGVAKGKAVSFCSSEEKMLLGEIEKYLQKPIEVLDIDPNAYEETIVFSEDPTQVYDWKSLVKEAEKSQPIKKKKKKK